MRAKAWLNAILSEPDNKTPCPVRLIGIVGTVFALVLVGYSVFVLQQPFDLQAYGIGFGALMATLGAALGIKTDSPVTKE